MFILQDVFRSCAYDVLTMRSMHRYDVASEIWMCEAVG